MFLKNFATGAALTLAVLSTGVNAQYSISTDCGISQPSFNQCQFNAILSPDNLLERDPVSACASVGNDSNKYQCCLCDNWRRINDCYDRFCHSSAAAPNSLNMFKSYCGNCVKSVSPDQKSYSALHTSSNSPDGYLAEERQETSNNQDGANINDKLKGALNDAGNKISGNDKNKNEEGPNGEKFGNEKEKDGTTGGRGRNNKGSGNHNSKNNDDRSAAHLGAPVPLLTTIVAAGTLLAFTVL